MELPVDEFLRSLRQVAVAILRYRRPGVWFVVPGCRDFDARAAAVHLFGDGGAVPSETGLFKRCPVPGQVLFRDAAAERVVAVTPALTGRIGCFGQSVARIVGVGPQPTMERPYVLPGGGPPAATPSRAGLRDARDTATDRHAFVRLLMNL